MTTCCLQRSGGGDLTRACEFVKKLFQQTRFYPYPLGAGRGLRDQIQKRALQTFMHRVGSARMGSQTMVSGEARPWGRGRLDWRTEVSGRLQVQS